MIVVLTHSCPSLSLTFGRCRSVLSLSTQLRGAACRGGVALCADIQVVTKAQDQDCLAFAGCWTGATQCRSDWPYADESSLRSMAVPLGIVELTALMKPS